MQQQRQKVRQPGGLLRRFHNSRKGSVAIIFALTTPLLVAAAGYGVETGYWHYEKLKVQEMADAAAYAGAIEKRAGSKSAAITTAAQAAAADNGFVPGTDLLSVNAPPTSGAFAGGKAVEAFVTRNAQRFFSGLFKSGPVVIRARSVSAYQTAGNACVLALNQTASRAAEFTGSSSVTLESCNVMSNSGANDAVYVAGAGKLKVPCIMSSGGVDLNSGATLTACAAPMTQLPPVGDPYADVPEPSTTGACLNGNGASLSAGRYCGGLTLKNNVSLAPGVYVIDGGTLRVNANASITGSGVTIFMTNGASVAINGNAEMNISAPSTGSYAGVLWFGSRTNTSGGTVTINGNASSRMTGAIYFPKQEVDYIGNFSGTNGCTQVVADKVSWSGNVTFKADCSSAGMPAISVGSVVKLAE
ncbi:MAG: pilus assembly protein TadG-related protein [Caulobacteraceae bacterium]